MDERAIYAFSYHVVAVTKDGQTTPVSGWHEGSISKTNDLAKQATAVSQTEYVKGIEGYTNKIVKHHGTISARPTRIGLFRKAPCTSISFFLLILYGMYASWLDFQSNA